MRKNNLDKAARRNIELSFCSLNNVTKLMSNKNTIKIFITININKKYVLEICQLINAILVSRFYGFCDICSSLK